MKRRPGGPLALRTAKACGPVPPTLGSSLPCDHAGGRRRLKSPVLRGERAIGRKPSRRERRCFGVPVAFLSACAAGAIRASGAPCALDIQEGDDWVKLGQIMPRERGGIRLTISKVSAAVPSILNGGGRLPLQSVPCGYGSLRSQGRQRRLTPPPIVIKHNYSGQDIKSPWETPPAPRLRDQPRCSRSRSRARC